MLGGLLAGLSWLLLAVTADHCTRNGQICVGKFLRGDFGVKTIEDCRKLCSHTGRCSFITFHLPNSFVTPNYCEMFSECEVKRACPEKSLCVTEAKKCFDPCTGRIEGQVDSNNFLERVDGADAAGCKTACAGNPLCKLYFLRGDVCYLLTSFQSPSRPCTNCLTGFPDCNSGNGFKDIIGCQFTVGSNRNFKKSHMFTANAEIEVTIRSQYCKLTVVAVGGGGSGWEYSRDSSNKNPFTSGGCGGGSGYVKHKTIEVKTGDKLVVRAGRAGAESTVKKDGGMVVRAPPGRNAERTRGGDGYSGGGGRKLQGDSNFPPLTGGGADGGYDGSDGSGYIPHGRPSTGGRGSKLKLSSIALQAFRLTPAPEGTVWKEKNSCTENGAGGGGVFVDGKGPGTQGYSDGGGFGGGQGGYPDQYLIQNCRNKGPGNAGQGVVLMEINEKPRNK